MERLLGADEKEVKASVDKDLGELSFDQTFTYPEWSKDMAYTPLNVPLSDITVGFILVLLLIVMFYARSVVMIALVVCFAIFFYSFKRILAVKYSKCYIRNFLWYRFGIYPVIDPFECPSEGKLKKVNIEYLKNR